MRNIHTHILVGVAAGCLLGVGCNNDSTTPAAPTPTPSTPPPADVAGAWSGTSTFTMQEGGGCVGSLQATQIGSESAISVTIEQSGTDLVLTLTDSETSNQQCNYTGTIAGNALTASLSSCMPETFVLGPVCAIAGDLREWTLESIASEVSATADGDTLAGTVTDTFRFTSGDESHEATGTAEFMLTR